MMEHCRSWMRQEIDVSRGATPPPFGLYEPQPTLNPPIRVMFSHLAGSNLPREYPLFELGYFYSRRIECWGGTFISSRGATLAARWPNEAQPH